MFSAPDSPIVPLPGESMTAAIFRVHDPFAGTGLTVTDQTAIIADDAAKAAQKLADCASHNAELMIANRAHLATIEQLRTALAKANELNADLQDQLDEAQANAASDNAEPLDIESLTLAEVAWAMHVEGHR